MHQFWSIQLWNGAIPDGFYSLPIFCLLKPTRETMAIQTNLPTFSVNLEGKTTFPSPLQEALCVLLAEKRTLCRSSSGSSVPSGDSHFTVALGCAFNAFTLAQQSLNQVDWTIIIFQSFNNKVVTFPAFLISTYHK